ncbi:MAG: hypothetical protein DI603_15035 [Roseateles depolymerans]|uniref:Lysozyme n=1 Tax=Roseateles depolymerans TaxID=76731 RepID=A0A2W5FCI8_9BURK|nr:MAG: hypothetical protein DI603_15035 [Roseateles depolymerans]
MDVRGLADGVLMVAAIALAFWLGSLLGHAQGGAEQAHADEQRERAISDQHAQALAAANERQRAVEEALRADLARQQQTFNEAMTHEKDQHQRLLAGLRSGAVRLSVPVVTAGGSVCAAAAGGDPAAAAGDRHEARAELAPEAAANLAAVADDGNTAIVQLNACIDRYNAVRERFNSLAPDHAQAQ